MKDSFASRLELLEERIESACLRAGRKRHEINLMCVTKFHPIEAVEEAWNAGIRIFGENRVQEALRKFTPFFETHKRFDGTKTLSGESGTALHLIGSLQRNKAKAALSFFDCVQSVDRDSILDELGVLTMPENKPLMVMLEYRTGEETKAGFSANDTLFRAAEKLLSFPGLKPSGLMTMAPFTGDKKAVRLSFRKLAAARDELEKRFPNPNGYWSCLSMGMSGDFEIAIEEGSTLIRIGTALFGERKYE